ncbi:lanthionine synthetase LanC family protein [Aquimarina sp. RZ0]|uniref:lanthionine synthetase LanC family protein n=1 Tax=Aquimarina sp. RZ0 TaxID=2607730 RepID=UPI0011F11168|nr:lanthionine synthetase LanC family protein [Aquimarina sp. RZ0]KAA1244089.1 hypothetical protein F0000_18005 [Aquimarina sp. RZ0]
MKTKFTKAISIKKIIKRIEDVLNMSDTLFHSAGLSEGVLGLSLFYYYLYLYTENEEYLDKVSHYLEESFHKFSKNKNKGTCNELDVLELGKYLCYLDTHKIIDSNTAKKCIEQLDEPIKIVLQKKITAKDLDTTVGIIAIGHYFLDGLHRIDYRDEIKKIILTIERLSIVSEDTLYWNFNLRDKDNPTVESGFFHGISGVILFLAHAFNKRILPGICSKVINKAIQYLLQYQKPGGINLFPYDTKSGEMLFSQNLAYGDIGIGYALYQAGILLKNKKHINTGLHVLQNSAKYRDDKKIHCQDAELIYGASGLYALFSTLHVQTLNKTFKKAATYWFEKIIHFNNRDSPWAGFETYINGFDNVIQVSFAHGICGIGITLISHQIDMSHTNYLSFFNYK